MLEVIQFSGKKINLYSLCFTLLKQLLAYLYNTLAILQIFKIFNNIN